MAIFTLDTSCMVAAVSTWHEHHAASASEINRRLSRGERLAAAAPALVEAYAVLTRLPAPHRLSPGDAWALVEANFVQGINVVALPGTVYLALLRRAARQGTAGGRAYDVVIAECAFEREQPRCSRSIAATSNRRRGA